MKILFVVLDGLGDIGSPTPLEKADTPNLDFLAMMGKTGLVYPVKGIAPGSGEAMLALLGYLPEQYYPGRGPLEALGLGHRLGKNELIMRGDLATFYKNKIIDRRAGGISDAEGEELAKYLDRHTLLAKADVKVLPAREHRVVVIIKGKEKLGDRISSNDLEYEIIPCEDGVELLNAVRTFEPYTPKPIVPLEDTKENKLSAELVNQVLVKTHATLKQHHLNKMRIKAKKLPANFLILRGMGNQLYSPPSLTSRTKKLWGIIAEMPIEVGVAKYLGMEVIKTQEKENLLEDLNEKIELLKKNWDDYDALYFYVKAADKYGHHGDFDGKAKAIEEIDKHFFFRLTDEFDLKDTLIVVTADHSTPASLKRHSSDPVPLLIFGKGIARDKVEKFGENYCKNGELGELEGCVLMDKILEFVRDGEQKDEEN